LGCVQIASVHEMASVSTIGFVASRSVA